MDKDLYFSGLRKVYFVVKHVQSKHFVIFQIGLPIANVSLVPESTAICAYFNHEFLNSEQLTQRIEFTHGDKILIINAGCKYTEIFMQIISSIPLSCVGVIH